MCLRTAEVGDAGPVGGVDLPVADPGADRGRRRGGEAEIVAQRALEPASKVAATRWVVERVAIDLQPPRHQNAYLKSHSWDDSAKWHFGLTVARRRHEGALRLRLWRPPSCHRMGLIAYSHRAAKWRHKEIGLTADELLQYLDTKSERRRMP